MRFFLIIPIIALFTLSAQAAVFYQNIPFNRTISENDQIIVDYDFAEKKAITCESNANRKVLIAFTYKGHQKTTSLPMTLESDHVPLKESEGLADLQGQFTLSIKENNASQKQYEVSCHYLSNVPAN